MLNGNGRKREYHAQQGGIVRTNCPGLPYYSHLTRRGFYLISAREYDTIAAEIVIWSQVRHRTASFGGAVMSDPTPAPDAWSFFRNEKRFITEIVYPAINHKSPDRSRLL